MSHYVAKNTPKYTYLFIVYQTELLLWYELLLIWKKLINWTIVSVWTIIDFEKFYLLNYYLVRTIIRMLRVGILLCSSRLISLKYKHLAVLYASCFSLSTIIVLLKRYCYGHLHQLFINFKFLLPLDKSINLYFIVYLSTHAERSGVLFNIWWQWL